MIKTIENFCNEKRLRFGYGSTQAAADDFFELGGGVFVITKRPRVGYTEGVVVTRGVTDEDRAELARRLRVNGSSANVDGSRINVRFRSARPLYSGGAGIQNPTPPPVVVTPYFENFRTVEVGKTSATLAAELVNTDQVPITSMYIFYSVNGGPNEEVEVQGSFSVDIPVEPDAHVIASCAIYYDGGDWEGDVLEFDTLPLDMPTVTTSEATDVTSSGATFGGVISNPDGVTIDSKWFKFHKGSGAWVDVPVEGDDFTAQVTGLDSNSNYSYRAYVVVGSETIQGDIVSFRTAEITERETPFFIYHNEGEPLPVYLERPETMDARTLEISHDGVNWEVWQESAPSGGHYVREITLQSGQRLYIRNVSEVAQKMSYSLSKYHAFHGQTLCCGGNMLSLLTKNFETLDTVGSGAFCNLFHDIAIDKMPKIFFNNAPEMVFYQTFPNANGEVELPAEVVERQAYSNMFRDSAGITKIVLRARDVSAPLCLDNWLFVAEQQQTQGVMVCYPELNIPSGASGIPTSWTREDLVD